MKKLALVFLSLAFTLSASAFADEQETKKDSFSMGESSLASFDMAYAEATKPCPREGEIGMSLEGLILSCQSGSWSKAPAGLEVRAVKSNVAYRRGGTTATCSDDEIVVGGGGYCNDSPYFAYDIPSGNGWTSGCMTNVMGYTWAMCAKIK